MGTRIYSLGTDLEGNQLIRTWEVVDSTDCFYYIQPREIPNDRALDNTRKIYKDEICQGIFPNVYYWSVSQLFEYEIQRQRTIIDKANIKIQRSNIEIAVLKELRDRGKNA